MTADIWTNPSNPVAGVIGRSAYITNALQNVQAVKNGLVGDASADAAIVHSHLSGTLAARPAPGTAGRVYYCIDLGIALIDDGTNWGLGYPSDLLKCDFFHDDLIAAVTSNWDTAEVGGTGSVVEVNSTEGSVVRLSTGTDSGSWAFIRTKNFVHVDALAVWLCHLRIKAEDAGSGSQQIQCGLSDGFTTDANAPTNGAYIQKDGSANFTGATRKPSATTNPSLGDAGGSMIDVVIECNGLAEGSGGEIFFHLNGFKDQAQATTSNTTNLPTGDLFLSYKVQNSASADRNILVDSGMIAQARA